LLLASLPGCGLFLGYENDWRFGEPPPAPPVTGHFVEGEVRDLVTYGPVPEAEVLLATDRPGYGKRTRTDAGGRFSFGFSALAREVGSGDVVVQQLLFANDPSDDLVSEVVLHVRSPGWRPAEVKFPVRRIPAPLVVYLERADDPGTPAPNPRLIASPRR
jgi:hypothetical protein